MKRMDHIGIDLGLVSQADERAAAAADLGARIVRVRFGLGGAAEMGAPFLGLARTAVAGLAERGLKVLAVIDSDLTVAPDGMGAFSDRAQGPLARAWVEEMLGNAGDLARALAGTVDAWELLPLPNAGSTPRIHPLRWVALLEGLSTVIRAADPQARIVTGALLSDDRDDGTAYLDAALAAAGDRFPGDALGLRLSIMAGGSPSEAILAAGLRDRVDRLTEVLNRHLGAGPAAAVDLWVTSVGWDAQTVGEVNQATNTWTTLSALSGHPRVSGVIWCGLTDDNPSADGMACGLYQGSTALGDQRRPAGNAFRDFSTYARQISMPAAAAAILRDEALVSPTLEEPLAAAPETDDAGATGALELEPQRPERVEDSGGWTTAGVAGAAALAALGPLSDQDRQQATEATPLPWDEAQPATPEVDDQEAAPGLPVIETPVVEAPVIEAPVIETPVIETPVIETPVIETPVIETPVIETPAVEMPVAAEAAEDAGHGLGGLASAATAAMAATAAGLAGLLRSITGSEHENREPVAVTPAEPVSEIESESMGDSDRTPMAPVADVVAGQPEHETAAPSEVPVEAPVESVIAPAPAAPARAEIPAESGVLHFHIPNAREVLEGMGYSGDRMDMILEAVRRRYGSHQWLPAGDYHVDLPAVAEPAVVEEPTAIAEPPAAIVEEPTAVVETPAVVVVEEPAAVVEAPAAIVEEPAVIVEQPAAIVEAPAVIEEPAAVVEAPAVIEEPAAVVEAPAPIPAAPAPLPTRQAITNQMMISALYRAGGGAWSLFDRAGLSLRDLAARRTQPYSGPAASAMTGLTAEEQAAVQQELDSHLG